VAYPDGPRHDLALYEMLLALVLTIILYLHPARARPAGYYAMIIMFLYAPARFALDFLRTGDRRYFGLTPAQYLSVLLIILAVFIYEKSRSADAASSPP